MADEITIRLSRDDAAGLMLALGIAVGAASGEDNPDMVNALIALADKVAAQIDRGEKHGKEEHSD